MKKLNITLIRITFDFYPSIGGSITHIIHLSKRINPYINRQIIIAPNISEKSKMQEEFDRTLGIQVIRIPYPRRLHRLSEYTGIPSVPIVLSIFALKTIQYVKHILNESNDPVVVYTHGGVIGALISLLLKASGLSIPLIVLEDSANPLNISKRHSILTKLQLMIFKQCPPSRYLIVDDGNKLHDYLTLCRAIGLNSDVVSHGVSTPDEAVCHHNDNGKFMILSTQRLIPFRRVDLAVISFKEFLESVKTKRAKLILVGAGSELKRIKNLVKRYNLQRYVTIEGAQPHERVITYYLPNADVVVGTSTITNYNLSIQEAMICRKPVVVFDSGRTRELIDNMKSGILVSNLNTHEFAEALRLLYENPKLRRKLGHIAYSVVLKRKNWDSRIKKELHILKRVIDFKSQKV